MRRRTAQAGVRGDVDVDGHTKGLFSGGMFNNVDTGPQQTSNARQAFLAATTNNIQYIFIRVALARRLKIIILRILRTAAAASSSSISALGVVVVYVVYMCI